MEKNRTISAKATAIWVVLSFSFSYTIINDFWQVHHQQLLVLGQAQDNKPTLGGQTFRSTFDTFVVSDPEAYGIFEERNSSIFKPGEEVLLYVEPAGITYTNTTDERGNKLYSMNLTADIIVSDKEGNILGGEQNIPISNFISRHQNKKIELDLSLTGTETLDPGDYILKYVVTDENSGKSFEIEKNITITNPNIANATTT